jgi:hypothetical protein
MGTEAGEPVILSGGKLTLHDADKFTKTELMHIALTYKDVAERLTAELAALEQVKQ